MKPSFQSVIDKQRLADYRLKRDKTTRSDPEIAHYQRAMKPVPAPDVELPKLPQVWIAGEDQHDYVLLGEIAQLPGTVLIFDPENGVIRRLAADRLLLVPPQADE